MYRNKSELQLLTLFDQVMYLVVFGNRSELDERIPPAERDAFFDGLVDSSSQLRANYAQSWKARRRHLKTRRQSGPPRCLSRFNRSDDEDEDKDGEGAGSGKEGEVQNSGEDAAARESGGEEKNQSSSNEAEDGDESAATQHKGD